MKGHVTVDHVVKDHVTEAHGLVVRAMVDHVMVAHAMAAAGFFESADAVQHWKHAKTRVKQTLFDYLFIIENRQWLTFASIYSSYHAIGSTIAMLA